ncbi:hypothetical protein ORJ04_22185, partial [Rheinheimera baltica]
VLMLEDLQEHRRIQITEDSYSSFGAAFSPDGRYIAYHRADTNGDCTIRLSLFDKKEFAVVSDNVLTTCGKNSPSSRVEWSPDAKYVIYPTMNANRKMVLMMKPVQGGAAEQLTTPPPSSFGDYAARFSFEGSKLVFLRGAGSHAQLWLLDIASRELKLLLNVTGTLPGNVGWSPDDRFVLYPSAPTIISKVDVETGVTAVVAYSDVSTEEIQTLKSGQFYATVGNFAHTNVKEVSNALVSDDNVNNVVFSSNRNESHAEANPIAGGPVAVVSRRSGLPQVWLFYDNGEQRQITFFEQNMRIRSIVFSPNGKQLILQLHNELWLLSVTGELVKIPQSNEVTVSFPVWSKTGEYVYFSESFNGRWQISRYNVAEKQLDATPFAFDQEFYIESYDGMYSFWRDGISKKFYVKWNDSGLVEEVPITFTGYQLWSQFKLKSDGVYFTYLLDDIYYQLKFYNFKTKKLLDVLDEQVLTHSRFSVSADEKRLYLLESVRGDLDIAKLQVP